jgi:hypothetical protein
MLPKEEKEAPKFKLIPLREIKERLKEPKKILKHIKKMKKRIEL